MPIIDGLSQLTGAVQGARALLSPNPLGKASQATTLPFYRFEVWNDAGPAPVADLQGEILTVSKGTLALRLPPSSFQYEPVYRAEVSLDMAGEVVVYDGGPGIGRCSIRGQHGLGIPTADLARLFGKDIKSTQESAGFLMVQALERWFEDWAETNKRRYADGKEGLRLAFSVRDGSWTEWQNRTRWIMPITLPTQERSVARPLDWAYSMSWWDLGPMKPKGKATDPAKPGGPADLLGKAASLKARAQALVAPLTSRSLGPLASQAQALANGLGDLRSSLEALRRDAVGVVQGVRDTAAQISLNAAGIMAAVNPQTFGDSLLAEVRGVSLDSRQLAGEVMRWDTTLGLTDVPSRAPEVVFQGTGNLQTLAASQGGGIDEWVDMARGGQLRWPYTEVP